MKIKALIFFIISLLFLFISSDIYAQQDGQERQESICFTVKPLQFGNDFLPIKSIQIDESFPEEYDVLQYVTDYKYQFLMFDAVRDPKRLGYNFGIYVGAALISYGVLWIMPESITGWDKESMRKGGMFKRWKDNVKKGPVWDTDSFYLNWIMHPFIGGVYYMSARGSGYKRWESFTFSFLMSTFFWEYGVEAFAEVPSWQDIIITPTVGSLIGEGFFIAKRKIIQNEKKVLNSRFLGSVSLFIIDPINTIVDGLGYKTQNKMQVYSSIAPVGMDYASGKSVWGLNVSVRF